MIPCGRQRDDGIRDDEGLRSTAQWRPDVAACSAVLREGVASASRACRRVTRRAARNPHLRRLCPPLQALRLDPPHARTKNVADKSSGSVTGVDHMDATAGANAAPNRALMRTCSHKFVLGDLCSTRDGIARTTYLFDLKHCPVTPTAIVNYVPQ